MNILICCESSGVVREAFRSIGHNAWSCDLLPADDGSIFHYQMDYWKAINMQQWDLIGNHRTCTFLNNASAWALKDPDYVRYPGIGYHQKVKPRTLTGQARRDAADNDIADAKRFLNYLKDNEIKGYLENPPGAMSTAIRPPDQIIQPHQFGEDASKATGLHLNLLPMLEPTENIPPRIVDGKPRWANQTDSGQNKLSPGDMRWKERSRTYPGIANAFAHFWGKS